MLIDLARSLQKQALSRAATSELNRVIREAIDTNQPPTRLGRTPRFYYAAQIAESPPTIVLHTNASGIFDPPYIRYLERTIRDRLGFQDVPIRLIIQGKGVTKARNKSAENDEDFYKGEIFPSKTAVPQPRKGQPEELDEFEEEPEEALTPPPRKARPPVVESTDAAKPVKRGKRPDRKAPPGKSRAGKGKKPPSTWDL